jgi:hypothetical protein
MVRRRQLHEQIRKGIGIWRKVIVQAKIKIERKSSYCAAATESRIG